MESLLYSLNATIPVFLVIVLGYVLKNTGMLNGEFVRVADKFVFNVSLPVLLYRDLASAGITQVWDTKYVLFCAMVTTICFFTIWFLARRLIKDRTMVGAFVQASFRSSAAILGIAFIQNIYGDSGMAPLMIVGTVPLYNIYSVIVLTFEAEHAPEQRRERITKSAVNILKNPIIIGIFLGILGSLLQVRFPVMIEKTINNVASIATPLALVTIGAGFEGRKALTRIKPTLAASFIKLVLQAAVFLPAAVVLGFRDAKLVALIIMLASPTTVSCYIMAKNMDNDGVLTSSIVVCTTLISAFTLTGWIYLLHVLQLI